MRRIVSIAALAAALSLAPNVASAQDRLVHGALGAGAGALVGGPIGAIAGGAIGFGAGRDISRGLGLDRPRYRRRASYRNRSYRRSHARRPVYRHYR